MTLQEVFKELELEGSYGEQCKQYAEMLATGNVLEVFPEELAGDDTSPDRKWSWSKKTSFINKHKNNVDFNEILCIFTYPLPADVFIIKKQFSYSSAEKYDRFIARIAKKRFVEVRVNYDEHEILSAIELSRKQIDREINQLAINMSIKYFESFLDMYEAEDGKAVVSRTKCKIIPMLRMYKNFLDGIHNREDSFVSLVYGLDLPAEEATWFLDEWEKEKENIEMIRKGNIKTVDCPHVGRFWFKNDYSSILCMKGNVEFSAYDIDQKLTINSFGIGKAHSIESLKSLPFGDVKVENGKVIIVVGDKCPSSAIEIIIENYGLAKFKNVIEIEYEEYWNKWLRG